jgi:hypothetical protein
MMRESQVRICERLGVKFPGLLGIFDRRGQSCLPVDVGFAPKADLRLLR